LIGAGYEVFAINPMSAARYRERHSTSGATSDAADAHLLAEIVRLDREHHRPVAGDSDDAEAIKLVQVPTRRWSGTGPVTCCGYRPRCGSSAQPPWRLSTTSPRRRHRSCSAEQQTLIAPSAVPLSDRGRTAAGEPPRCRGQGRPDPDGATRPRGCGNRRRCSRPTPSSWPPRSSSSLPPPPRSS
jgi:Transposase